MKGEPKVKGGCSSNMQPTGNGWRCGMGNRKSFPGNNITGGPRRNER